MKSFAIISPLATLSLVVAVPMGARQGDLANRHTDGNDVDPILLPAYANADKLDKRSGGEVDNILLPAYANADKLEKRSAEGGDVDSILLAVYANADKLDERA